MIELMITIFLNSDDEQPYDTDEIPLTLATLAPITSIRATSKSWSKWECHSFYLGKGYTGPYYVMMSKALVANPGGFFHDSEEEDPFLILQNFQPMNMKKDASGDGLILRTKATDLKWRDVKWRRVS